ncbi:hypothetical protein I553_1003 [Mycobacterium xenopi 4042]|uniref:Uncharacterized protein n=1 Tax=Mycobacterium xenopi 4042 TaxID=1299334 RepID=X7ZB78_MYCXE|nr:hypothetical protein I553_1003 [Mycobacterium xenopi 4042]
MVEDLLNFSEHVVAMSRCLDIGLGLAVQYDVGDFADFDRKWVFGALNLLNPRIPILRYCIELAQQLSAESWADWYEDFITSLVSPTRR